MRSEVAMGEERERRGEMRTLIRIPTGVVEMQISIIIREGVEMSIGVRTRKGMEKRVDTRTRAERVRRIDTHIRGGMGV